MGIHSPTPKIRINIITTNKGLLKRCVFPISGYLYARSLLLERRSGVRMLPSSGLMTETHSWQLETNFPATIILNSRGFLGKSLILGV